MNFVSGYGENDLFVVSLFIYFLFTHLFILLIYYFFFLKFRGVARVSEHTSRLSDAAAAVRLQHALGPSTPRPPPTDAAAAAAANDDDDASRSPSARGRYNRHRFSAAAAADGGKTRARRRHAVRRRRRRRSRLVNSPRGFPDPSRLSPSSLHSSVRSVIFFFFSSDFFNPA